MASIYTTVDIDVDIEIDEFVDSCSERDMKNLVKYLSDLNPGPLCGTIRNAW